MRRFHYARHRSPEKLTHYLFRFPAKLHAPVVRRLIESYSEEGQHLLDPFCGSGTLLVEALVRGRQATGIDVDPVAVFVARTKSRALKPKKLDLAIENLLDLLSALRRPDSEYDRLVHEDFVDSTVERYRGKFNIPLIPNIHHWFRNYVTIDLARMRQAIQTFPCDPDIRRFFLACFASIIRNASNADPVPVSGLEVTAHMIRRDEAGRRIDPFTLFERKLRKEAEGMTELWGVAKEVKIQVRRGDASLRSSLTRIAPANLIITSPPYNTAVDYYRRHTLEMYWLGLVQDAEERVRLAQHYIGRDQVRVKSRRIQAAVSSPYIRRLISHAESVSAARARALQHYAISMERAIKNMAAALKPGGRAAIILGNAKWNGRKVRATRLIEELAGNDFDLAESFSYVTANRYMSYTRHNDANVDREYVLVFDKKRQT